MAKVTLIGVNDVVYELGIRSLAAYLKAHGHDVQLLFLTGPDAELSGSALLKVAGLVEGSVLVGVSLLTHSLQKAVTLTRILHLCHPSIPVLWGGIHATGFPHECLEHADLVCLGEGEEAMLDVVERVAQGQSYATVPNICLKNVEGEVICNPVRPFISDLDTLPFQDYSLENDIVLDGGGLRPLGVDLFRKRSLFYSFAGMGHVYVTMTSRGCPFNCTFCCNDILRRVYKGKGPYVRKRSAENVVHEIRSVMDRHPFFQSVLLEDDSFLFRKEDDIRQFAMLYKKHVDLPFGIEMNPNESSEEKLRLLKEGGLTLVHVGVQSGDNEIRKKYYARTTSDQAIYAANRALTKLRILHKYDIIIDTPFPGDAVASLKMLRNFAQPFSVNLYSLRVYPGLALEKVIRDAGFQKWIERNNNKLSYNQLLGRDPYTFVLKRYKTFPPTWRSRFAVWFWGLPPVFGILRRLLASWTGREVLRRIVGEAWE